jgi:AcrR family transcriptional regulator
LAILVRMSTSTEPGRPLRRDAERNRRRILEAAREVFAAEGLSASLDDIAHHAGLGVGTVYRRFPDKEQLIDALFDERLAEVHAVAEEALAHEDPWEGVVQFFERSVELQARDRGLKELLLGSHHGRDRVAHARDRMAPMVIAICERAKAAGALRPDVEGQDFPLLQLMLGTVIDCSRDVEPELWRRFLALLLDGLRAPGGDLPVAAVPLERIAEVMRAWRPPARR